MRVLLAATLFFCVSAGAKVPQFNHTDGGSIYALLVAGSNTWMNYRHQADACHAYQILHQHGVPDENIVVMMYDDIAHNRLNRDGTIINHINGPDVYPGVPHDYTKEDVKPENFLNILQGHAEAMSGIGSGKVIRSGPNDYVFVYFVDHGAPGFVSFPDAELTAKQLNDAIRNMHSQNKFKQMVVYVEACESGSMFADKLPSDINVYATTAANTHESSYACYYDQKLGTYLGDLYSVNWMENVDSDGTATETLEQQYKIVKHMTNKSHVMQYGDLEIDDELLRVFMGSKSSSPRNVVSPSHQLDAVPSGDVPIAVLMHRVHDATDYWQKKKLEQQLMEELMLRERVRSTMEDIVHKALAGKVGMADSILGEPAKPTKFDCYIPAVRNFSDKCFNFSEVNYALRHVYALSNLCEAGVDAQTILEAIEEAC